ncbi:MAG: hypothetical protein K0S70_891 [Microbacterium sp.]|jgi:hypothetical protein|nr:hypothetical protein [Microbacterium sp.]
MGVKPPYREIAEWIRRDVMELAGDSVEPPDGVDADVWERVRETYPFSRAFWTVRLTCGHFAPNAVGYVDWDCEDGPMCASASYLKGLRQATECRSCVHARLTVGYRAVSGPAASAPPSAVDRKRLAARLAAAEAIVSRLRMRLEALERCSLCRWTV